jgi:UDPglucose 6-dehydrogenase
VRAFDPEAATRRRMCSAQRDDLALCDEPYAALDGADALVVMTEWKMFWSPDFERIRGTLRSPVLIDGRNIYDPKAVEAAGLAYYGIGRGRSVSHPEVV